jgi:hypothetical protein
MNDSKTEAPHVFVVSGRRGGEFCSACGLHWTDECHTRSMAVAAGRGVEWTAR